MMIRCAAEKMEILQEAAGADWGNDHRLFLNVQLSFHGPRGWDDLRASRWKVTLINVRLTTCCSALVHLRPRPFV